VEEMEEFIDLEIKKEPLVSMRLPWGVMETCIWVKDRLAD